MVAQTQMDRGHCALRVAGEQSWGCIGLREDMRSLQGAACVGGKVMGEDEKFDKTAWTNCWPSRGLLKQEYGRQRSTGCGALPIRGAAGAKRDGHTMAVGPRTAQGTRGKPWPGGAEGEGRGRCPSCLRKHERSGAARNGDLGTRSSRKGSAVESAGARQRDRPSAAQGGRRRPPLPARAPARSRPGAAAAAG